VKDSSASRKGILRLRSLSSCTLIFSGLELLGGIDYDDDDYSLFSTKNKHQNFNVKDSTATRKGILRLRSLSSCTNRTLAIPTHIQIVIKVVISQFQVRY
jgi:hypothetical protein